MKISKFRMAMRINGAMRRIIFIGMVVLGISSWGLAEPATIADVHTLQELRDVQPIHVSDDCDIRLGIGDGGEDAGPWGLIYCLAESKTGSAIPTINEPADRLGPVFVRCQYGERHENENIKNRQDSELHKEYSGLYCRTISLTWAGKYHIDVLTQSGEVLASKEITIEKPRPCYWAEFAAPSKAPGGYPCVVRSDVCAAMARFYQGRSMLTEDQLKLVEGAKEVKSNPLPGEVPLASCWFASQPGDDGKYPLVLSLKDDTFVIHCRESKLMDWPDKCLLARWWVNDQLIEAPRASHGMAAQSELRKISQSNEMRVVAGFPHDLGELHVGDVVGVQVLYSPGGIEHILAAPEMKTQMLQELNNQPMILESNRVDIKVTPELLAKRSAATQPAN